MGSWSRGMIFASHFQMLIVKGRGFNSHRVHFLRFYLFGPSSFRVDHHKIKHSEEH